MRSRLRLRPTACARLRLSAMSDNVQRTLVGEVMAKMAQKRLILLEILGAFAKVNK